MRYQSDYKSGDLIGNVSNWHDFGVGLLICKTGRIEKWGMRYDPDEHMRWYVLWSHPPPNPEANGYSIGYETEFKLINSA